MPYIRFAPQADNRRGKQATVPIEFNNVYLERSPDGAGKRSDFFVTSRPGRTRRANLGANCRGVFSEPGCREGNLFAPAGAAMIEVFPNYSYSSVGALSGGDSVKMRSYRDDVAYEAFGAAFVYDGATQTQITDMDFPATAGGLASVALRLISFEAGAVAFSWSRAGLPLDWPSDGEAATPDLVDPIVSVEEVNDDLWVFGKRRIRPWQATGSEANADAFTVMPGGIRRGLIGDEAIADIGGAKFFIGDNRAAHITGGGGVDMVANRDLELALAGLSDSEAQAIKCWAFEDGSRRFAGVSAGLGQAYVLDLANGLWSTWSRYGVDAFDIDYAANAFSARVVASNQSPYLWTLDRGVYSDDGDPLVRSFVAHVAAAGDVPVDRLVLDLETVDVPLEGDGAEPMAQIEYSTDNGQTWINYGDVDLPHANDRFRVSLWGLGQADAVAGMLIKVTISAPFGFAAYGLWVNPTEDEVTLA